MFKKSFDIPKTMIKVMKFQNQNQEEKKAQKALAFFTRQIFQLFHIKSLREHDDQLLSY